MKTFNSDPNIRAHVLRRIVDDPQAGVIAPISSDVYSVADYTSVPKNILWAADSLSGKIAAVSPDFADQWSYAFWEAVPLGVDLYDAPTRFCAAACHRVSVMIKGIDPVVDALIADCEADGSWAFAMAKSGDMRRAGSELGTLFALFARGVSIVDEGGDHDSYIAWAASAADLMLETELDIARKLDRADIASIVRTQAESLIGSMIWAATGIDI